MFVPQEKLNQCTFTLYDYLKLHAKGNGEKSYFITETETMTYAQAYAVVNGLADSFEALDSSLQVLPRLRMYLSMAYLRLGDADRAESLLLENGGLQLADAREGDRFLDVLYKGIRFAKYGEAEKSVCVPMQFDFIVARKEEE